MQRTQVQLTDAQASHLKRVAAYKGVSMSEVVRDALDTYLSLEADVDRRAAAIRRLGGFRSGRSDISEEHDRYLEDAFQA